MAKPITSGHAFPTLTRHYEAGVPVEEDEPGMNLRDYFAAKALQPIIATSPNSTIEQDCQSAYRYADEMLKQREKRQ